MSHGLGCFWGPHPKIKIGVCVKKKVIFSIGVV
jgi:hypothetical protein